MTQRVDFTEAFDKIRENLHFILVEPETPGNIGSVARALKTCGFKKLILVNPADITHPETAWMAHQSMDIIQAARIVPTFEAAINDMSLIVGTTMRDRKLKFPYFTPSEASHRLKTTALTHPVAIVFGRESSGLSNEELFRCHIHTTIQTAVTSPALNLAQSVMIYAHTFFLDQNEIALDYNLDLATNKDIEQLYAHLLTAFEHLHFSPRDSTEMFLTRCRRLLGRAQPEKRDIRLLHKIIQVFEKRIAHLETELRAQTGKCLDPKLT